MASMLRSLRFVQRLNTDGSRLGVNALNRVASLPNFTLAQNVALKPSLRCSVAYFNQDRNYVTNAAVERQFNSSSNVDELLRELDYNSKKYGYVHKDDLKNLLDSITARGTLTSTQALLMIRCCGYFMLRESIQTRQEFVNKIWNLAKSLKVPLDVSHYNALLLVYLDNETDFSPLEILVEMKENNIAPNRVTFQRLIEQYCNKGDISGATKILEHMSLHEIPLNENIFNSLILGHSAADDITSALKILDIMKQTNVEPTSRTYSAIMCAHARNGDLESLQSVLLECKKNDIIFSDKEILDVIYKLAINKHYNSIDEMISNIEKSANYNKNALQIICKLLDNHEVDVAFKLQKSLIKTTNDYSDNSTNRSDGFLFLKKLIFNERDKDIITKYCSQMVKNNISPAAFENALYIAYTNDLHHLALPLLKVMKQSNCELREQYFYPIFVYYAKTNNLKGILNTVKTMFSEFNVSPLITTLKNYVLPYMGESPIHNLETLLNNNVSFQTATNAIIIYCLEQNKTNQALKFLRETNMLCRMNFMENALVYSFINTKNVNDFINILHYCICTRNKKVDEQNEVDRSDNDSWETKDPYHNFNNVICKTVSKLNSYDVEIISNILQGLLKNGLRITDTTANHIKTHLEKNITSEIEQSLNELTSSNLELVPLKIVPNSKVFKFSQLKMRDFKNLIEKAENSVYHKMLLIQECAKTYNDELLHKLQKELEEQNVTYTVGFCASLIDYYSKKENLEEAEKWYKHLHEIESDCKLDVTKIFNYAYLLVKNNRYSDALKLFEHPTLEIDLNKNKLCENFLIKLSTHCPDQLEVFFNKLKDFKYFSEVTSVMLSPIIKYYISIGNMEMAIKKFQWAVETYKVSPYKSKLIAKLINDEDAKTLQHVVELCTQVYGETNALIDLAISFLECNKPKQARKILETVGLRLKQSRIEQVAKNYVENNNIEMLEKFIQIVSGLRYDVNTLYYSLLQLYEKKNDWQKSLALWTQMQEDNIQPSIAFMSKLENILRVNNQEIPFVQCKPQNSIDSTIQKFSNAISNGNLSEAKEFLEQIPKNIRSNYLLLLIDHYLNVENVDQALANLKKFWEIQHTTLPPFNDTLINVIKKLKKSNDFQNIIKVLSEIKEFYKKFQKSSEFTFIINKMYRESNQFEDLFEFLEKAVKDKSQAKQVIKLLFHPIVTLQYLFDHPEFEERLSTFANDALEHDIYSPINAVWAYKFLNNSPNAESFFKNHIKQFYSLNIIYSCKELGAWAKMPQLCDLIMESNVIRFSSKKRNANIMLKLIVDSDVPNKYDIAFQCLCSIVKVVPFNNINKAIIQTLQQNYEDKEALQALCTNENMVYKNQTAATG